MSRGCDPVMEDFDVNPSPQSETENPVVDEGSEQYRQLSLEMLRRENQQLSSKLDALTDNLRAHRTIDAPAAPDHSSSRRLSESSKPSPHLKVPGAMREVLLVFEGDLAQCDRAIISAKLLHLKRLLHRRLESRLSPSQDAAGSLMHALLALHRMTPAAPGERIRVQASQGLEPEKRESLKREISSLVSFTQGMTLNEADITLVEMQASIPTYHVLSPKQDLSVHTASCEPCACLNGIA